MRLTITPLALILTGTAVLPVVAPSASAQPAAPATRAPARPTAPAPASHAVAPAAHPAGPKAIGKFDDWTAATNMEAGQTVCYAFTRAQSSAPALSGRGDVVLTVTERITPRDAVALSAGFAYAANASVAVAAEGANFAFYTAQRSAFARDGHDVVAALQKATKLVAKSPAPRGSALIDTFSLRGFSAAYAAIVKACPPK